MRRERLRGLSLEFCGRHFGGLDGGFPSSVEALADAILPALEYVYDQSARKHSGPNLPEFRRREPNELHGDYILRRQGWDAAVRELKRRKGEDK